MMRRRLFWYEIPVPAPPLLVSRRLRRIGLADSDGSAPNLGLLLALAVGVGWLAVKIGEPILKPQRATRTPPVRGLRHLAGG